MLLVPGVHGRCIPVPEHQAQSRRSLERIDRGSSETLAHVVRRLGQADPPPQTRVVQRCRGGPGDTPRPTSAGAEKRLKPIRPCRSDLIRGLVRSAQKILADALLWDRFREKARTHARGLRRLTQRSPGQRTVRASPDPASGCRPGDPPRRARRALGDLLESTDLGRTFATAASCAE